MKTKEEILIKKLEPLITDNILNKAEFIRKQPEFTATIEAMQSYADQCVKAREEEIKEWVEDNVLDGSYIGTFDFERFLSTPPQVEPTQEIKHPKLIVGEDMICPVTGKHCDDECCTVGSECNLGSNDGAIFQEPKQSDKPSYQDLFRLMQYLGLTLLQSEMQEIIETCKQYNESTLLDEVKRLKDSYEISLRLSISQIKKGGNCIQLTEYGVKSRDQRQIIEELTQIINAQKCVK